MILQAYALSAKFGKTHLDKIYKTQLIGDGAVIDLETDIINETIHCPDKERV